MLEETSSLLGLDVFTPWGVRVGTIADIEIDYEEFEISNLFLEETNELLVERGADIMIPYRWVHAAGDIILLRYFPEEVPIPAPEGMEFPEFE
ncbi:MAG: PRC-barrel domain-containing protein [Thermoplasmatota archaeon]